MCGVKNSELVVVDYGSLSRKVGKMDCYAIFANLVSIRVYFIHLYMYVYI